MRHINVQLTEHKSLAARGRARLAFTMVELLVVIGISVLLFSLLLIPLVNSLSLTQQAQATAAAQDSGRKTMEVITRELGSAAFIYDGASHPFAATAAFAGTNGSQYPVDRFTNFLNLQIPTSDAGGLGLGHVYDAKLDFVNPRHQPGFTDPTTDSEAKIDPVTKVIQPTDLLLPSAPGTTMVRYFVGLKNPELPYRNTHENSGASSGADNTYVLYRAQFAPFNKDGSVNANLFAVNAAGKIELDDPDFFRKVNDNDVNWLDPAHAAYGGNAAGHNSRLASWEKIAQRVIGAPQVDLLLLPHKSDGSISYDTTSADANVVKTAHYGAMTDPVTGDAWPVVNTSVNFRPTVTNDATPATNVEYASAGVPANAVDNDGLPYIPTLYRTTGQSWNEPFTINLYPANFNSATDTFFRIERATADVAASQINAGDLVEYQIAGATVIPVCNITKGAPVVGSPTNNYIPALVNPDAGTIRFAVTALPDTTKPFETDWNTAPTLSPSTGEYLIDMKTLPKSPLGPAASTGSVQNAVIVPGSVRVFGPEVDENASQLVSPTSGSTVTTKVLYRAVGPGETPKGDQYRIDYKNGTILFDNDSNISWSSATATTPISVQWSYQANLTTASSAQPISLANPALPMTVKVDYQSRDLIAVNIGIRIYPTSGNLAQIVPVSSNVKVGNSNR
ncbi:MAG: hypothetical protein ABIY70_09505 [Capsulimonas sp.]|uniref:hypothetical protein n=1 Tax=Capsulimonas sp. TaxID=2494211 RepID=UPI003267C8D1